MKKKMYKTLLSIILTGVIFTAGCGKEAEPVSQETTIVAAQNDWNGAFSRLAKIQQDVMNSTVMVDSNNYEIIAGNPNDYWNEDGFHYLNFVPVYSDMLMLTMPLNEQQEFAAISATITENITNMGYKDAYVNRIAEHHYEIGYSGYFTHPETKVSTYAAKKIECIYEASHDWLSAVERTYYSYTNTPYVEHFYEFVDLGNGLYAIQTEMERLYVSYKDGALESYVYTKLKDGVDLSIEPIVSDETEEIDEDASPTTEPAEDEAVANQEGQAIEKEPALSETNVPEDNSSEEISDEIEENPELVEDPAVLKITDRYFYNTDSAFLNINQLAATWPTKYDCMQTKITFQNGILEVYIRNKLTNEMEYFSIKVKNEENKDEAVQESSSSEEAE